MGLIKASNAPATVSPFSMADIEKQAGAILLRARQQADQLLADASHEATSMKQRAQASGFVEGRDEGLRQGYEQGRAEAAQQALEEHRSALTHLLTSLNAAVQQIEQSRAALEHRAVSQVIRLAIAIADRVTKRAGALDPNVLTENARAAMKMVVHSTDLRIALHPSQKHAFERTLPQLQLEWPTLEHVQIVEDEKLAAGGCRIFTRDGLVDADLDEQLRRIADELLPDRAPVTPDPAQCSASERLI